ncbi:hypothetical protein [Cellulomonas chitinilytica]|uniref:hypothetical protein n=1 Tax=Cellulomonas chitinilytica TaxID=398759 RepID=UPI0019424ECC|nr:hypothetical protein [Cellulomonas chitinilytica]
MTTPPPDPAGLDLSPLRRRATRRELWTWRREQRARQPRGYVDVEHMTGLILVWGFGGFVAVAAVGSGIYALHDTFGRTVVAVVAIVALATSWVLARVILYHGPRWRRWARLATFARVNGWSYDVMRTGPAHPAARFARAGTLGTALDVFHDPVRRAHIGNHVSPVAAGMVQADRFGYVVVELGLPISDRPIPRDEVRRITDSRAHLFAFEGEVLDGSVVLTMDSPWFRFRDADTMRRIVGVVDSVTERAPAWAGVADRPSS